ncbi:hypothetical protein O0I10_003775 [Lichtheimia ornata]|uniref:Uncharacterized protein n=1 Tax=Lichtheimia ornata TaxID=688661 RepID=A0AAD7V6P7_9FUNG|nr:uncharacterized protein O0I10_003775 [Lichtheimia ornata]KAJ8660318.1 hypothetical protein O0I10_003775 [Lichtheimia ornata]
MIHPFIKDIMVDMEDTTSSLRLSTSRMLDHFISLIHHDNNSRAHSHINKAVVTNTIIRPFFLLLASIINGSAHIIALPLGVLVVA